ncbi:MAG TPA: FecR domain-containing protein [Allosphingosinicella sp.]|nr:FecR domain-containing protein [Allosphingosinicella sp.]
MRWPFVSRRERVRREAADWIARLNGSRDEQDLPAFQSWYRSSAERARAYDRLSGIFEIAGQAVRPPADIRAPASHGARGRPVRYALAAAAACAAALAFFLLSARLPSSLDSSRVQVASFAAEAAEGRTVLLADGSEVLLSQGSALDVRFDAGARRLRLTRGEARFSVVHERRPFVVEANGTEVVARGTEFVVRLSSGRTTVSLIRGLVDVSYSPSGAAPDQRRVTRLEAGQRLVVDRQIAGAELAPATPPLPARAPPPAPAAMLQFDDLPLAQAVEQVSRHGSPELRLGDPALARLRVTGAFHSGDTAGFAQSVAAAFDLAVDRGADGRLWLRARSGSAAANRNGG